MPRRCCEANCTEDPKEMPRIALSRPTFLRSTCRRVGMATRMTITAGPRRRRPCLARLCRRPWNRLKMMISTSGACGRDVSLPPSLPLSRSLSLSFSLSFSLSLSLSLARALSLVCSLSLSLPSSLSPSCVSPLRFDTHTHTHTHTLTPS